MSVQYVLIDSEFVSKEWFTVLKDMRADGVWFVVNEGHRTMARQWYFWNCYQCKCCNNGNLAAYPSASAPHIRTGYIDHAIDFANPDAVVNWLRNHGLNAVRNVPGENWHVYVPAHDLAAYHKKHSRDKYDVLPEHVEKAVRSLLFHRKGANEQRKSGKGPKYRKHVRWRKYWRRKVKGMLRRADNARTKKILRDVLDVG